LWAISNDPVLEGFLLLDAQAYAELAQRILEGDWLLGPEPFGLGPLYAYLLAGCWALFGQSHFAQFAVQSAAGLASVWLITRSARRLSSEGGACMAGCAFAIYGPAVMLEGKLFGETFAVFFTLLCTYFLSNRHLTLHRTLLSGASMGAACLLRPDLLLVVPLLALWIGVSHTPLRHYCSALASHGKTAALPRLCAQIRAVTETALRRSGRRSALWLGAVLLVVSVATIRNILVSGEGILISSQGGVTFYQGNNPRADGTFTVPKGFSGDKAHQESEAKALAESALGRPLSYSEVSSYWYGLGFDYWVANPEGAVALFARKVGYWVSSLELSSEYNLAAERCIQPGLKLAFLPFGLLLIATVGSLKRALRRNARLAGYHLSFALAGLLMGLIFYVSSRYRLCAAAHLAVFVGPAFDAALGQRGVAPWSSLKRQLAVVAIALTMLPWNDAPERQAASQLRNLAFIHYSNHEPDKALPFLVTARQTLPDSYRVRYTLGHVLALLGDYRAAVDELEVALRLRPLHAETGAYLQEYGKLAVANSKTIVQAPLCEL
jgi:tetratricopeptide (TPR) repeat protein